MANLRRSFALTILTSTLFALPAAAAAPPSHAVIKPTDFVMRVDHPYFPLDPGTVFRYVTNSKASQEVNDVVVSHDTKIILGVMATVVLDSVYTNGDLTEATADWYAQDKAGNVWYFGEDSKELDHGQVVSTEGSWEAGVAGAQPGIIMEANPEVGDTYQQEFQAGVAEDMAKVTGLDVPITVPYGSFSCLETLEWTHLTPNDRARKYYARGVGNVLELAPKGGQVRTELVSVTRH
jgi:hypothetical protein